MTHVRRTGVCLTGLMLLGALAGCHRNNVPSAADPPGPNVQAVADTETGPYAAGKRVFAANDCRRCHSIGGGSPGGGPMMAGGPRGPGGPGGSPGPGGPGGPGGGKMGRGRGPDLAHVGDDPTHTVEWLMQHVRDPKAHKPESRMPVFEGKINDADLRALGEYLASLK